MPGGLILIINQNSSQGRNAAQERIAAQLDKSGVSYRFVDIGGKTTSDQICETAAYDAKSTDSLLVACGGDGTVRSVAEVCMRHSLPLGIIPLGTFNYFARELGIPDKIEDAADLLLEDNKVSVSLGTVNDRVFLNNASIGIYTKIIRNREADKAIFGRYRIVALLSAFRSFLQRQKVFAVHLRHGTEEVIHRTTLVLVSSCQTQLQNLGLGSAELLRGDKLAVVVLKPLSRGQTARLFLHGLLKRLSEESRLEEYIADDFTVTIKRKQVLIAIDGEIFSVTSPLAFKVLRNTLQVVATRKQLPSA